MKREESVVTQNLNLWKMGNLGRVSCFLPDVRELKAQGEIKLQVAPRLGVFYFFLPSCLCPLTVLSSAMILIPFKLCLLPLLNSQERPQVLPLPVSCLPSEISWSSPQSHSSFCLLRLNCSSPPSLSHWKENYLVKVIKEIKEHHIFLMTPSFSTPLGPHQKTLFYFWCFFHNSKDIVIFN